MKAWLARPWLPTIVAATLVCLLYLVGVFASWGDAADRALFANVGMLPVGLAGTILAWSASKTQVDRRSTWAWRLIALSFGCFFAGDALFFAYQNLLGKSPFPSMADVGYILYYPLMLVGLLAFPTVFRNRLHRTALFLDGLIMFLGGGMIVSYFFLIPTVTESGDTLLTYVLSVGYPAGDLLLLAGVAYLLLGGRTRGFRLSHLLLSAGLLVGLAADLVFGYQNVQGMLQNGGLSDAGFMVSWSLFAWASYVEFARVGHEGHVVASKTAAWIISPVPYAFVAASLGLLVYVTRSSIATLTGFVVVAITALVIVLVVRQIVGLRESALLQARGAPGIIQRPAGVASSLPPGFDHLADLPGRGLFKDRVECALKDASAKGRVTSIILLDLDDFGAVNSTLGQRAGDDLLVQVARRLEGLLQTGDTAARLGDDEFAVLLGDVHDLSEADVVARRFSSVFERPFVLGEAVFRAMASMGLATSVGGDGTADELLRRADEVMRWAKVRRKAVPQALPSVDNVT